MKKFYLLFTIIFISISCNKTDSTKETDFQQRIDSASFSSIEKIKMDSLKDAQKKQLELKGEPINDIGNSLIFVTEVANEYSENPGQVIAIPIFYYSKGNYQEIPTVMEFDPSPEDAQKSERARRLLLPIIKSGNNLYALNNGVKENSYQILNVTKYGFSDWQTFSAVLENLPPNSLLSDNEKLGTNQLGNIVKRPVLKKRLSPEKDILEDKLLSKVDVDGDGFPELIYQNQEYEGVYYTVYSNKNGNWKKVYEGGYQGL